MSNITPSGAELPTPRALVRSTLLALAVAAVVLVGFILPAEYGVDPTGIGGVFGLTEMGRIKVQLAQEAAAEDAALLAAGSGATPAVAAADSTAGAPDVPTEQVTLIPLAPGEGKEVKLEMDEGGQAVYAWSTDRGVVNYDTHADGPGDPANGVAPISYHGYGKGTAVAGDEGVLVAAFDGKHGWFWRNRTRETLTVTLRTSGDVQGIVGP
ncbi:transmembrane anchor protein [Rubrivirga sp. IMCC45206]|uniref:transmembrane anchor protein n=1 Tax=Rubrivirga sp. IMCC45206 TaxID=3391614 RepID=UPI00398FCBA3